MDTADTQGETYAGALREAPMRELVRRIVQARAGGAVERAHGIKHHGSYTNGLHSWGVAMLMLQIWPEDFPRLAAVCLTHDVPEAWVGDNPAPMCRYAGIRPALHKAEKAITADLALPFDGDLLPEDKAKLKACDMLEFWLWCREQANMGNMYACEGQKEIEKYISDCLMPEPALQLYNHLRRSSTLPKLSGVIQEIFDGHVQGQLANDTSVSAPTAKVMAVPSDAGGVSEIPGG